MFGGPGPGGGPALPELGHLTPCAPGQTLASLSPGGCSQGAGAPIRITSLWLGPSEGKLTQGRPARTPGKPGGSGWGLPHSLVQGLVYTRGRLWGKKVTAKCRREANPGGQGRCRAVPGWARRCRAVRADGSVVVVVQGLQQSPLAGAQQLGGPLSSCQRGFSQESLQGICR